MRRHLSKQKDCSISQKVKQRFRYSPSYQAQKCHSKLPLRYNNIPSNIRYPHYTNQIISEYSSVKQKNIETNQCNDTSSWIAKLVSGIQDEDQENKNLQKLSQIENRSVSDLPEDSREYGQNQFLTSQGESLFTLPNKNLQQPSVQKPIKKSIRQAMIEIELKQNTQGLRGPPVTRINSSKRQVTSKKISKKTSANKNQVQKESTSDFQKCKNRIGKYIFSQKPSKKTSKNKVAIEYSPLQNKRSKSLRKAVEKSVQVSNLNLTYVQEENTVDKQHLLDDRLLEQKSNRNTSINSGTKKQSLHKINIDTSEHPTRKNSFISKEQLSEYKNQYQIVEEHSRNLNMKNLFSEANQCLQKAKNNDQPDKQPSNLVGRQTNKRVGGIKKNSKRHSESANVNLCSDKVQRTNSHQNRMLQQHSQQISQQNYEQKICDGLKLKYNYLSSDKKQIDFTLNHKTTDKRILFDMQDNIISSFRQRGLQKQPSYRAYNVLESRENQNLVELDKKKQIHPSQNIQRQTTEEIKLLFNKLKLDTTKQTVSKANLKLRGLTEQQKTKLGSVISKIQYQNAVFDFGEFSKEFRNINAECSLKGCFSQDKLKKIQYIDQHNRQRRHQQKKSSQQHQRQASFINLSHKNNEELSFDNLEGQFQASESAKPNLIGHRRRNSKIIKRKLFEEIKRISYLEQIAVSQLQKNSRVSQISRISEISRPNDNRNTQKMLIDESNQNICKDPYIQGPSLAEIQVSNRFIQSFKNHQHSNLHHSVHQRQNKKLNIGNESSLNSTAKGTTIQKLNKKLTTYIDKNQIQGTFRQFNLNFSQLKKHFR